MALIALMYHRILSDDIYDLLDSKIVRAPHMYTKLSDMCYLIDELKRKKIHTIHHAEIEQYKNQAGRHGAALLLNLSACLIMIRR